MIVSTPPWPGMVWPTPVIGVELIVTVAGPSGAVKVIVPLVEADDPGVEPAGIPASNTSVPGAAAPGIEVIVTGLLAIAITSEAVRASPSPSVN